jgi:predicted dehydrogenase
MTTMKRRDFIGAMATAGTGLLLGSAHESEGQAAPASQQIDLALIGYGGQGRNLADTALLIPGVRFRAICDIWPYRLQYGANRMKQYRQNVNVYSDYRRMLAKEKDLTAVLIATPDFVHAEQTNACLKAGLHVYCESMMADTLEAARTMVLTARQTARLLQIGYQRRSHPCYRHVAEKLLRDARLLGRITQVQTRWSLRDGEMKGWPQRQALSDEALKTYGYASMKQFRNWVWFRRYGPGLAAGLLAHQIDAITWLLKATPTSVLAAGGVDGSPERETFDNLTLLCAYPSGSGVVRACGQVLTDTRADGVAHCEQICGTEGTLRTSENPAWTAVYRDPDAAEWDEWVRRNLLVRAGHEPERPPSSGDQVVRETRQVEPYGLPPLLTTPPLQPHLANFMDAIRGKVALHCPAEAAFRTQVIVHKAIAALRSRHAVDLTAKDFAVS